MINQQKLHEFLEGKNIPYKTSGKNVTEGWTNIQCPFCSDSSNHLGISPQGYYNCWVCGEKGTLGYLIARMFNLSFHEGDQIAAKIRGEYIAPQLARKPFRLPRTVQENPEKLHLDYLERRNFNPYHIITKYDLKFVHYLGNWKFRIIIPVYQNGELVNYLGRTVVNNVEPKYKNCPNTYCWQRINDCLYNIDSVKESCIIVEGTHDVWRIGDGAVGLFGAEYTDRQLDLLFNREGLKNVYVMLDHGMEEKALELAEVLQMKNVFVFVGVIDLQKGDPCDMNEDQVNEIRELLGG